jgi:adenine/guanine phosphoribosyltransferase-like PRPP-binding protein
MIKSIEHRTGVGYPMGIHVQKNLLMINKLIKELKLMYPTQKLNIWCRGSSGAIIAAIISSKIKDCAIYHIKKEQEHAHQNSYWIRKDGTNIIVDDLISSGQTIKAILKAFSDMREGNEKLYCLCILGEIPDDFKTKFENCVEFI